MCCCRCARVYAAATGSRGSRAAVVPVRILPRGAVVGGAECALLVRSCVDDAGLCALEIMDLVPLQCHAQHLIAGALVSPRPQWMRLRLDWYHCVEHEQRLALPATLVPTSVPELLAKQRQARRCSAATGDSHRLVHVSGLVAACSPLVSGCGGQPMFAMELVDAAPSRAHSAHSCVRVLFTGGSLCCWRTWVAVGQRVVVTNCRLGQFSTSVRAAARSHVVLLATEPTQPVWCTDLTQLLEEPAVGVGTLVFEARGALRSPPPHGSRPARRDSDPGPHSAALRRTGALCGRTMRTVHYTGAISKQLAGDVFELDGDPSLVLACPFTSAAQLATLRPGTRVTVSNARLMRRDFVAPLDRRLDACWPVSHALAAGHDERTEAGRLAGE